VGKNAVK